MFVVVLVFGVSAATAVVVEGVAAAKGWVVHGTRTSTGGGAWPSGVAADCCTVTRTASGKVVLPSAMTVALPSLLLLLLNAAAAPS